MANLPRPGIINLDFADVSRMAQDIQANDPLRQLLGQGSQFLRTRDDRIKYDRALAELEGRDISDESTTTGEGVGKAYDWLKKNSGKAYDTVKEYGSKIVPTDFTFKNPFVTEEVAYEEGDRIESPIFDGEMSREDGLAGGMSREDTMSRLPAPMQTGTKTIFPTTVVGKNRMVEATRGEEGETTSAPYLDEYQNELAGGMSRESDGMTKFSPEGERVSFPTTVVGAPSEIASPVEGSEVAVTKLEAPMAVKRPRSDAEIWSELNRLNSQRAGFDYNRVKNEQTLANEMAKKQAEQKEKADINSTSNIKEMAVQFRNYAGSIGSTNWNNFSDAQKSEILAGYKGLRTQLSKTELGKALIGEVESELETPAPLETPIDGTFDSITLQNNIDKAFTDEDNPKTTTVEGLAKINKMLTDARIKAGVPENDPTFTTLQKYIKDVASSRSELATEKKGDVKEAQQQASQQFTQFSDFYPSYKSVVSIQKDPSNATNVQLGVSELLKILSGTGVSDKERANTILALTPTAYQEQMRSKAASIGKTLADAILNMDQIALAEYSKNVDPTALAKQLGDRIPPSAWKWAENQAGKSTGGTSAKPTKRKDETMKQYMDRLNAWKAKGGK